MYVDCTLQLILDYLLCIYYVMYSIIKLLPQKVTRYKILVNLRRVTRSYYAGFKIISN